MRNEPHNLIVGALIYLLLLPCTLFASHLARGSEPQAKFKIISADYKVEDVNTDMDSAMISWKVIVESELSSDRKVYGKIKFLDTDGFEVDGAMFGGCITGGDQQTFTGMINVSTDETDKIVTAKAELLDDFPCD